MHMYDTGDPDPHGEVRNLRINNARMRMAILHLLNENYSLQGDGWNMQKSIDHLNRLGLTELVDKWKLNKNEN